MERIRRIIEFVTSKRISAYKIAQETSLAQTSVSRLIRLKDKANPQGSTIELLESYLIKHHGYNPIEESIDVPLDPTKRDTAGLHVPKNIYHSVVDKLSKASLNCQDAQSKDLISEAIQLAGELANDNIDLRNDIVKLMRGETLGD